MNVCEITDNTSPCPTCGLKFVTADKADRSEHNRHHTTWVDGCKRLGYTPALSNEREEVKALYWPLVRKGGNLEDRAVYALRILRTYFDGSLEGAIHGGYELIHPDFSRFVQMLSIDLPDDVMQLIRKKHGPYIAGEIRVGFSSWIPSDRK